MNGHKDAMNKYVVEMKYDKISTCCVEGQIPITYTQAARIKFDKHQM
jgi:hypothetical protein